MKVTAFKTFTANASRTNFVFVKLCWRTGPVLLRTALGAIEAALFDIKGQGE